MQSMVMYLREEGLTASSVSPSWRSHLQGKSWRMISWRMREENEKKKKRLSVEESALNGVFTSFSS